MKILSYGDDPYISTGYGTVWLNLLTRWVKLKPDWEFYHVGWQNQDRPHKVDGYTMLPVKEKEYGYDTVTYYLLKYRPDFLITLADVGWQSGYIDPVAEAKKKGWKGKWIAYTPIDTNGWAYTWDEILKMPDINVAMSKFGEAQMKKHNVENVICIPHGVDTKEFKPLAEREELRKKYNFTDKFVCGFVGRNQKRKMLDRGIFLFDNFAKGKEDVLLLLHTDVEPVKDGWSLPYLLWQIKENKEKIKLTKSKLNIRTRQLIDEQQMNEIYNLMDVFLYFTGGEGFGLPGIECQAAGVPLLMTDTTTAYDLCREEFRIPILKDTHGRDMRDVGQNGVYFHYPDDILGAQLLEKVYNRWKETKLEKEREDARNFSLKYDWDLIAPMWLSLFEREG